MKIGLVCPYGLFSPGGVKEHALALYREFKKRGHQVKVLAPGEGKSFKEKDFLLLGHSIKAPMASGSWGRLSACLESGQVTKVLRQENFEIIHFHEPLLPFLSWQLLFASQAVNIVTLHSAWEKDFSLLTNFEFLIKPFAESFEKKLDGLMTVSLVAKRSWQKFFEKEIKVIPNGIDLERFRPRVRPLPRYQDGKINLLFVGRLEKRKGVIYLLQALTKMKRENLRVILVGSGPRRIQAELLVKTSGLDEVEFIGRVTAKKMPRYYASADICCFPSIGGESFGIVLLEAMASAKPLVCFANPGYQEVLKNYPFPPGLVKVGDVTGLAQALTVLSENASLRKKLGRWGRQEAQKYRWNKIADQVFEYYQKIRQNKKG